MTIGPMGGILTLDGQQGTFMFTIPPTALMSPTEITITETAIPPPAGFVDYSPVYSVEPLDLALSVPASLVMPYSNGRGVDVADDNLAIFWSASASTPLLIQRLPSSQPNAGFETGSTLQGGYAIIGYASAGRVPYCN
jgi:hypothetical protein